MQKSKRKEMNLPSFNSPSGGLPAKETSFLSPLGMVSRHWLVVQKEHGPGKFILMEAIYHATGDVTYYQSYKPYEERGHM